MERLTLRFDTDDILMCISGETQNFRYQVDPTYKQNRKATRKPLALKAMRAKVMKEYPSYCFEGLEADDVLGIFATRLKSKCIVVSEDKDLKTIPCTLYRAGKLETISEAEADYFFFTQVLTGDTADGYPGLPGVGPVKALAILSAVDGRGNAEAWRAIVKAYTKRGLTEDDAIRQARLARILRSCDWDAKLRKPILWTPER